MSRISTKHTPGPWTIQACQADQGESIAICEGSNIVAIIPPEEEARDGEWSAEDKANANLISAAPEMLEALKGLLVAPPKFQAASKEMARAAIAKAEGRV